MKLNPEVWLLAQPLDGIGRVAINVNAIEYLREQKKCEDCDDLITIVQFSSGEVYAIEGGLDDQVADATKTAIAVHGTDPGFRI